MKEEKPVDHQDLFSELYGELKKIAKFHMKREKPTHTLQPTALINEAYLKMMSSKSEDQWENKKHFLCTAAKVMRQVLIDSARSRQSQKRGGNLIKIELNGHEEAPQKKLDDVLSIHQALLKLEKISPEKAELVNLRFFGGLTVEEAAEVLGISRTTANKNWNLGRALLYRELTS